MSVADEMSRIRLVSLRSRLKRHLLLVIIAGVGLLVAVPVFAVRFVVVEPLGAAIAGAVAIGLLVRTRQRLRKGERGFHPASPVVGAIAGGMLGAAVSAATLGVPAGVPPGVGWFVAGILGIGGGVGVLVGGFILMLYNLIALARAIARSPAVPTSSSALRPR